MSVEQQNRSSIITVDDEGDGDYTSIKTALANANPGDTIEVYSGTYHEYLINIETEDIVLQGIPFELGNGSDTGKPFIDGEGHEGVLEVRVSNITVDGFRMENPGPTSNFIFGIYHDAHHCMVSNNDFAYVTGPCVWIFGSYTQILNNNISHSAIRQGIVLRGPSNNNVVRDNVIDGCDTGILTWESENNLIEGNTVRNCEDFGIDIGYYDNIVRYNTIENNTCGLQLMSIRATVTNNNFIANGRNAIFYNTKFIWMYSNRWKGNYWDRPRILPYPILGQMFLLPWIQFDWRPALTPYVI
jgi:parallel beta-helix repeat protein